MNKVTTTLTTMLLSTGLLLSNTNMMPIVTASTVGTVNSTATIVNRESWKAKAGNTDTENLQFNVMYFDDNKIAINIQVRESISHDSEFSIGSIILDDHYWLVQYDESFTCDSNRYRTLTTLMSYTDDTSEWEFIKIRNNVNVPTGTSFNIVLTKFSDATGSSAITAFGHELNVQAESIATPNEAKVAELQAEIDAKNQTITELQDNVTQLTLLIDIKNQMLEEATNHTNNCDVNNDGTVNVLDLVTLKQILLGGM